MSVKMKFGSKDIPFVYKGDKLIYPNPIKDGLLLWYDFKGMRNTDVTKEVAKDLSGNGNDGTLTNFNFTEGSGYKDNALMLDGIDDKVQIPDLELDISSMTVELNGKTYTYDGNKVISIAEDGEVITHSRNLLLNSGFTMHKKYWHGDFKVSEDNIGYGTGSKTSSHLSASTNNNIPLKPDTEYIYAMRIKLSEAMGQTTSPVHYHYYDTAASDAAEVHYLCDINGDRIGSSMTLPANEWVTVYRYVKTVSQFVSGKAIFRPYLYSVSEGVDYEMDWMYFIESSKPEEEWSPNPLDFTSSIYQEHSPLDSLQFYNKTLSKDDLLHNAENKGLKKLKPGVVVQDGLVLHYDFSHENNTSEYKDKAFDYSGSGNHGELQNFNFTEESGYAEDGLKFDGVDDQVVIPYENNTFSVDFTWSAVIKPYIVDKDMMFMYGSTTAQYFRVQNGKLGASVRGQDSPVAYTLTSFALDANTVYHVALSHTNGEFKIYANGEQVGESDRGMKNERYRLSWIGKYTSADPRAFEGEILSVQVHNKALSPEEIVHNYEIEKEKYNITEGDA